METALHSKLERLREALRSMGRVAVAFSGGVDSALVLKVAVDVLGPANVLAVTGKSPSVPAGDLEEACSFAKTLGVEHVLIDPGEFEDANYLANPANRCYYCKDALFSRMESLLAERKLRFVVSGTNADDLGDYRPGLTAAKEHSVREPCAEAGLTKADIRDLSEAMDLPTSRKPASPCLSSRVPYGEPITPEKLGMIDRAETFLRGLMAALMPGHGAPAGRTWIDCRVRHHGKLARIEAPAEWIEVLARPENRTAIETAFREIGFQYVALDLRGFRSGSLNEVLPFGRRQGEAP